MLCDAFVWLWVWLSQESYVDALLCTGIESSPKFLDQDRATEVPLVLGLHFRSSEFLIQSIFD